MINKRYKPCSMPPFCWLGWWQWHLALGGINSCSRSNTVELSMSKVIVAFLYQAISVPWFGVLFLEAQPQAYFYNQIVQFSLTSNFKCISNWILVFTLPHIISKASFWSMTLAPQSLFLLSFSSSCGSCSAGAGRMDEGKKKYSPDRCDSSPLSDHMPLSVAHV